jgi:gluconate 2-dehydrogenase gamma chain
MGEPQKILTAAEECILTAIAERIFPKTDTPGAVEIGAVDYIRIALARDYAALVPLYRMGLRAANRHAQAKFAAPFLALTEEKQDFVLKDFEAGAVPRCRAAAEFFATVQSHVLEGIFCEPHYGGNKNMMGWKLVDFPGQQFGYADPYINKRVNLEPVAVDDRAAETKPCRGR